MCAFCRGGVRCPQTPRRPPVCQPAVRERQPRVLLNWVLMPSRSCLGQDFLNGGPPYPLFPGPVVAPTAEQEDAPGVAVRPQGGWA